MLMEHLHNQELQIEEVINSLQHISRAEVPPFFYTRLLVRMQKTKEQTFMLQIIGILTRPAFAIGTLSLFVILNTVAITTVLKDSKGVSEHLTSNDGSLQTFVKEYDLSVSTLYSDTKTNE